MAITRVYVDPADILGQDVRVNRFEEPQVRRGGGNPYRVYELSCFKEPSTFLITDNVRTSPKVTKEAVVKEFSGLSVEYRRFRYGGKDYAERVFVVDNFAVE